MDVEVSTNGDLPGGAEYARAKIGALGRLTHRPVLHARVRLTQQRNPAVVRLVIAQANLDVDGRLIRAQVGGSDARQAIDRLQDRLKHLLERSAEHWEGRRGALPGTAAHQWRHQSVPTERPAYHPRPAEERRIVRRKSFAAAPCSVDEAALEMDLLDYSFHLFVEESTGAACVLYRGGATGYRLALLVPALAEHVKPFELAVTISQHPAPCITVDQAMERLGLLALPFLFFVDAAQGRASVLYHRYDGHYGLITPSA